MRRMMLMIAASLLILMPSSVSACFEDHKAGWFEEMPAGTWEVPGNRAEGFQWETAYGLWIVAAGSASLALVSVSIRAVSRANGRDRKESREPAAPKPLALPLDRPIRIDQAHDRRGSIHCLVENAGSPLVGDAPAV